MPNGVRMPTLPELLTRLDIPGRPAGFMSDNLVEITDHVRSDDTGHLLRPVRDAVRATLTRWDLFRSPGISVILLHFESGPEFEVHRRPGEDCYVVHIPLSGDCEIQSPLEFVSTAGRAFAFNPGQFVSKRWTGACWQIMVYVDRQLLEGYVVDHLGIDPKTDLLFEAGAIDMGRTGVLLKMILSACDLLATNPDFTNSGILRTLDFSIICAVLMSLPHNYTRHFARGELDAAPAYLQRARKYIHENYDSEISVGDLARVSRVSERLIHDAFRRWCETTPMAYVRHVRFTVARATLRDVFTPATSVTDVAMAVGYRSLSQFSREYRERFGETPSTTLRNARLVGRREDLAGARVQGHPMRAAS